MPTAAERAPGGRHVAVFTAPAHSHIAPLLGTVAELVRRGLRVSYVTTGRFAALVESAGATAVPIDPALPADPADWPGDVRRLPLLYLAAARATLPGLAARFAADRPDLVLTEDPAGAGSVLAATWGVPSMQVWTYLADPRHWSLADPGDPVAAEYLGGLGSFLAEQGIAAPAAEFLDEALAGGLVLVPRSFQPDGDSFGPGHTFVGPTPLPAAATADWPAPPGDAPLALVALGSIDHGHPEFFATAAQAFDGLDWRVVLAIGDRTDPAVLGPLPANVRAHAWVPQPAVLAQAALAVHHGGMGTVMESLQHGVPSVVVPRLPEQARNARRLRQLGLGVALPPRSVTAELLRRTVLGLHRHEGVRARVNAMREEIRRAGGAPAAADAVLRRLPPG